MLGLAALSELPISGLPDAAEAQEEFLLSAGFVRHARSYAEAQKARDKERERVAAAELAEQIAAEAIKAARRSSAPIKLRASVDIAKAELARANAEMGAAMEALILQALAVQANNRLAEMAEESVLVELLLELSLADPARVEVQCMMPAPIMFPTKIEASMPTIAPSDILERMQAAMAIIPPQAEETVTMSLRRMPDGSLQGSVH